MQQQGRSCSAWTTMRLGAVLEDTNPGFHRLALRAGSTTTTPASCGSGRGITMRTAGGGRRRIRSCSTGDKPTSTRTAGMIRSTASSEWVDWLTTVGDFATGAADAASPGRPSRPGLSDRIFGTDLSQGVNTGRDSYQQAPCQLRPWCRSNGLRRDGEGTFVTEAGFGSGNFRECVAASASHNAERRLYRGLLPGGYSLGTRCLPRMGRTGRRSSEPLEGRTVDGKLWV